MTELSYFVESGGLRTGSAPPPDTLVALLELPRGRLSSVTPAVGVRVGPAFDTMVGPALDPMVGPAVGPAVEVTAGPSASARARALIRTLIRALVAPAWPRVVLVTAAGVAGAAPSLGELLADARAERPGARLLVALLAGAAVLGVRAGRPYREPDIHDRDVDWLLALPLLAAVGFYLTAVAGRIGPAFGEQHLGLLAVPALVAASTIICFGTRAMWRLRLPLVLLLLGLLPWPGPGPAAVVSAGSRLLLAVVDREPGGQAAIDPGPWLTGSAGPAGLLAALVLLSALVGRRLLAVTAGWVLLTVLRAVLTPALTPVLAPTLPAGLAQASTGVVADLLVCLGVLAVAVLVVRRAGRPAPAGASRRLAPITRCLDITAVRLRGTAGERGE